MNKYQESLDKYQEAKNYVEEQLERHGWTSNCEDSCNLIQELIDNYCKIINELDNLFHEIEFEKISKNQLEKKIKKLYREVVNGQ